MCAIGTGSESNPAVLQQKPQKKEPRRRREERCRLSLSSHRLWPSSPAAARPADRNHHPHSAVLETGDVLTCLTAAVPPAKEARTRDVTLNGPTQGRRSQIGTILCLFFWKSQSLRERRRIHYGRSHVGSTPPDKSTMYEVVLVNGGGGD